MFRYRKLLFAIAYMSFCSCAFAATVRKGQDVDCSDGKSSSYVLAGYVLRIQPVGDGKGCSLRLSGAGKTTLIEEGTLFAKVMSATGADLNDDGFPDLVLETYSGGAHCCWTYWVISLAKVQVTVLHLPDLERAAVFNQTGKGWLLESMETGYDYLRTSHAAAFFPDVYFLFQGNNLVDVSCDYRSKYDREIAEANAELRKLDANNETRDKNYVDVDEDIRFNLIRVIGSYLYSGRPRTAWLTLEKRWPRSDQNKLKKDLQQIRREGLFKMAKVKPCEMVPSS